MRSVLASDLRELEVIVVEQALRNQPPSPSTDIQDPRVLKICVRAGRGMSRSKNIGIARARAPYVAILEADDLVKPKKFSASATALDHHPEAGFAYADFEHLDQHGATIRPSARTGFAPFSSMRSEPIEDSWSLIRQPDLARGLLEANLSGMSGVVVRRQLLTEIGPFDESVGCCAELDLWFRLVHRCHGLYSSEAGHSHRNPRDGHACPASQDCVTVLRRERDRWTNRVARRLLDRRIARSLANVADYERRRGDRLRSSAMFAYAFATSPDIRWLSGMLSALLS